MMENDVTMRVDHANGDGRFYARRFRLNAICDVLREGEQIHCESPLKDCERPGLSARCWARKVSASAPLYDVRRLPVCETTAPRRNPTRLTPIRQLKNAQCQNGF